MKRVIVVEVVEYNLLLNMAFTTNCRAIDTYYITTASIVNSFTKLKADIGHVI